MYRNVKYFIQLTSILAVFTVLQASAQENIEFGVKGGYVRAAIKSKIKESNGLNHSGFTFGGYARIPVIKQFSFQPELLFTLRGDVYEREDVTVAPFMIFNDLMLKDSPIGYMVDWTLKSN